MSRNIVLDVDYYLGCDVSKSKIDVALVDRQGTALWTDKVPNAPVAVLTYLLTLAGMYSGQTCLLRGGVNIYLPPHCPQRNKYPRHPLHTLQPHSDQACRSHQHPR